MPRYHGGEACLSVARSYLPTAAPPRRRSRPVSCEAFAAMLPITVPLVAALLQRGSLPVNDGGNIASLKERGLALRLVRATKIHSRT